MSEKVKRKILKKILIQVYGFNRHEVRKIEKDIERRKQNAGTVQEKQ